MLGSSTTLTYAADWTEYASYRPDDGSGDVFFNLDPLWASPAIGVVGIDNYMPLSDWRDTDMATGNPDGARHANDATALAAAIEGGEGFDWYYASDADRLARQRLAITDGLAGKDWLYRVKDLRGWWQNQHHDRVGGVDAATPSPWVPGSKPFWFTELGCPAVDKGPNQPNVFPDPGSSEGALPYLSTGARDDLAQRGLLEAHLAHWSGPANADGMVSSDRIHIWTWDARPFPAFPVSKTLWSDGDNWQTGHWLNGRLGTVALKDLIAAVLSEAGFFDFDVSGVDGVVDGHVIAGPSSPRAVLAPLIEAFCIDVRESPSGLVFASRLRLASAPATLDAVAEADEGPLFEETLGEAREFANEAVLTHADPLDDHAPASARSRRLEGEQLRQRDLPLNVALGSGLARMTADRWLRDHRLGRRRVRLALPPQAARFEPGDTLRLSLAGAPQGLLRIVRIEDGDLRRIEAVAHAGAAAHGAAQALPDRGPDDASAFFAPHLLFLDLPLVTGDDETGWARAAASGKPWRPITLSSSVQTEGYQPRLLLDAPARTGRLTQDLPPGLIEGLFDSTSPLEIELDFGGLESASRLAVLGGANAAAVRSDSGLWEVIQFETAEEVSPGRWRLMSLLRGQAGTDDAMRAGASQGADFVMLDGAVKPLGLTRDEAGRDFNWIAEAAGAAAAGPIVFAGGERAVTPLSPVHLRCRREALGVRFSWIRRGRLSADSWTAAEIPNDEGFEGYRVELLDGASVMRTVETGTPEWLYPAADEIADFGAPQSVLAIRVAQAGRHVPWGVARTATLNS